MIFRGIIFSLVAMAQILVTTAKAQETLSDQQGLSSFTIWPLVDYRENPKEKSSRLSLLGPIVSFEKKGDDSSTAFRPFYFGESNDRTGASSARYLYPLSSSGSTPETSRFEFLHILQNDEFRKDEATGAEHSFMLFPFIISGESKKYGPYTSVFPFYGDLYERYWRDEYHYVLFPLYLRTVKKGTTNHNLLWPFFTVTSGEKESGFSFWPLYGHAAKEGVYSSTFALWPIYLYEKKGLDTDNPSTRFNLFPLYSSFESAQVDSQTWLWPFFSHIVDNQKKEEEWDYLWPIWLTVRGEKRTVTKFLPFYSDEQSPDSSKNWYLWPLYRTDSFQSSLYRQERQRLLYFLFTDRVESWAVDDKSRRRTALWPLFVYTRDTEDNMSITLPAPVEPILDREGIEKSWAPLWRLYSHQWNGNGHSSLSIIWNLYWHEKNADELAWELFPLVKYSSTKHATDLQFLKGLIKYREQAESSSLSLFWLPMDFTLSGKTTKTTGESNH